MSRATVLPLHSSPTRSESVATRRKRPGRERGRVEEITLLRAWCAWATRGRGRYLRAILRLPLQERLRDRGASFGSVQNIFLHIIEDYNWWFDDVVNDRQRDFKGLVGEEWSERDLKRLSRRVDRTVRALADSLTPKRLGREYLVKGVGGDGKPYTMTVSLADIMWHMLEEELQHRGELNALFWQMDIDPRADAWFGRELKKL
jgi:uncharacterized damage-inducible protein DinB